MDIIGIIDFIAFLAILMAIIILWRGWDRALEYDAKLLFTGILVLTLFHNFSNTLEWGGITSALDPFEDYAEILDPILWVFFFYAFLKAVEIAERMRVEEALRKSEERYTRLFEDTQEALFVINLQGEYQDANPAALALVGYSMEELRKMKVDDLLIPGAGLSVMGRQRAWQEGRMVEVSLRHKDGHSVLVELAISPVRDQRGQQLVMGLARDITERARTEAERKELQAQISAQARQIQQTIDTVPEGVLLVDKALCVVLANPVAEKDLAVLAGAKVGDILTRLGDRPLAELLTSPPTKGLWHEVRTEGSIFEVISRPMENGPEPENWVLVIRDVTREREIERHNQQQERLAAVGQLAAGIAHDFNNIMTVVVLYTQMGLGSPDLPPGLRERLQIILQQTERATDLVQQVLDFGRRAVLERRLVDVGLFLKEQVKLLRRTLPESIRIELTCESGECIVNADATRMQQVIINLAVNARDSMPEGGELHIKLDRLRIETGMKAPLPEMETGEWVRVRVGDNGSGISPDVLPHIFEPFFTTKEVGKGIGLGLAQVYGIVKQHDGHIDVASETGAGTTFALYLPVTVELQPQIAMPEASAYVRGAGEMVLVVEDDAILREALVATLEVLNYRTLEAASGIEALEILDQQSGEVRLVLSDLVMPEMGGQALFHAIQQCGLTVPVVILSGHPMENELKELQELGLAGWMLKPPSLEKLAQQLAQVLKE